MVVNEPGENARRLGGVEAGDFVAPPFASDLIQRRLQPAGNELFVEAWGTVGWQVGSWVDCRWFDRDRHCYSDRFRLRILIYLLT